MDPETTSGRGARKGFPVVLMRGSALLLIVCTLAWLATSRAAKNRAQHVASAPGEPPLPEHPIFGRAIKTIALDRSSKAAGQPGIRSSQFPPATTALNMFIGETPMSWSAGGYLYFQDLWPASTNTLWEFAQCRKTDLREVLPDDLTNVFVRIRDKASGPALFGTNWFKNSIRVSAGQVVLARPSSDPRRVYALQIAQQDRYRATIYYLEIPNEPSSGPSMEPHSNTAQ